MSDPTQMVPMAGGPDGPPPAKDPRRVAIVVLAVIIGVLLLALIIVSVTDDGDQDDDATTTTTSSTEPTTTTTSSSTTTSSTTTSTTTGSTTTTTTSTTTTTAPPTTIAPARCTGATGPTDPDPVAVVFYDAWRVADTGCAAEVANQDAIDTLFAFDGAGAQWQFQGCSTFEDPEPEIDCAYTYEGGSTHFEMQYGAIAGWQIVGVSFVAD